MLKPGDIVTIGTATDRWQNLVTIGTATDRWRPMGIITKIEKQGRIKRADVLWVRNGRIQSFDLNNLVEY